MEYLKGNKESVKLALNLNKAKNPDGYLYILKQIGFDIYKIGVSANPKRRIYDIDSNNPFGLKVICLEHFKNVYELEECIHLSFKKNLLRKEWFKIHKDDVKTLIGEIKDMSKDGFYLIAK